MKSDDCVFCKIIRGEIASSKIYEDEKIVAFDDIHPAAPVHFLIIPKEHIATLNDVREEHAGLLSHILLKAKQIAKDKGIAEKGYRQVINCNEHGGQVVFHLHLHILGGRQLNRMG